MLARREREEKAARSGREDSFLCTYISFASGWVEVLRPPLSASLRTTEWRGAGVLPWFHDCESFGAVFLTGNLPVRL